jgi:hypothetical protein
MLVIAPNLFSMPIIQNLSGKVENGRKRLAGFFIIEYKSFIFSSLNRIW